MENRCLKEYFSKTYLLDLEIGGDRITHFRIVGTLPTSDHDVGLFHIECSISRRSVYETIHSSTRNLVIHLTVSIHWIKNEYSAMLTIPMQQGFLCFSRTSPFLQSREKSGGWLLHIS